MKTEGSRTGMLPALKDGGRFGAFLLATFLIPAFAPVGAGAQEAVIGDLGTTTREALDARRPVWDRPTLSFYGTPGILDMPTATAMHDGDVSLSAGYFGGNLRYTLTFQITPRLSGSFRYAILDKFDDPNNRYDRSFDLRYLLQEEGDRSPAVSVGLIDFGGSGEYASEFIAATKTFNRLQVTGGIGWGRLSTRNGFSNPLGFLSSGFETRPGQGKSITETGKLDFGNWFRGDAALFGGVQYQVNDRLVLSAEYSSDAYLRETERMEDFSQESPLNFGATYRFRNGMDLTAAYMYGTELGLMFNYTFSPQNPAYPGGVEPAGLPVLPRDQAAALGWGDVAGDPAERSRLAERARAVLAGEGLVLDALEVTAPDHVTVYLRNPHYNAVPEALGRAARGLSNVLPPEIGTMTIVPVVNGMAMASVTLQRDDLEELEYDYDGAWKAYSRARVEDAADHSPRQAELLPKTYPRLTYALNSYVSPAYFDPDNPLRIDAGPELALSYAPVPGLIFSSNLRYPALNQRSEVTRKSNSVLPHVRSDAPLYDQTATGLQLSYLTGEYFFRPGEDLYGRVTAGYLERMYAGVSGEVLWKPVTGPWAFGAEINYAVQRDYDLGLGLLDYDIVTGHASAYYDFGNGFLGQIDAGRYLAGDWGATFTMTREFNNGVRVGAFFTLTDVSTDDFGEGSFDKGITFYIPLSRVSGEPSRDGFGQTIRPVTRDGGARLDIRNRLYETVRGYHDPELREDWGKFWR